MTEQTPIGGNRTDSRSKDSGGEAESRPAEAEIEDAWDPESYSKMGRQYLPMAGALVEYADVTSDETVLDVGCGPGSVAVTAAHRGADVAGLDVTPSMLERAAENADLADVGDIGWHEGDATELPFGDDEFDSALSNLGHMYADPPDAAAAELCRVTRPGGRIGFTSWTPTSVYPALAGLVAGRLDPDDLPDFSEPPFMWGEESVVKGRLEPEVDELEFRTETIEYPALSPAHFLEELTRDSGTFSVLLDRVRDDSGLRDAMIETIEPHFDPDRNAVRLEYLLTGGRVAASE